RHGGGTALHALVPPLRGASDGTVSTRPVEIAPSILSADFLRLGAQVSDALDAGVRRIHVDVMDGHFVPNLSMGPLVVAALRPLAERAGAVLEVHLMIAEPDRYLDAFSHAGATAMTVHVEACHQLHRTVDAIRHLAAQPGVALNPATPIAAVEELLPDVDVALVMSVDPGFGGQAFIPASIRKVALLVVHASIVWLARNVDAAGFQVNEQSARGLGSAVAGEAAAAEDASTIFFNPAGMTRLSGTQFVSSGFVIKPTGKFHNEGSRLNSAVGGGALGGQNDGNGGSMALLQTLFISHELLSDRAWIGLGASTPYGLRTSWTPGWVGRYHAIDSELLTANVNSSLPLKLTRWLSIGGGADIDYA